MRSAAGCGRSAAAQGQRDCRAEPPVEAASVPVGQSASREPPPPTDEGNTASGGNITRKTVLRACHCRCRRRARPHEDYEDVRGTFFSSSSSSSSSSPPARARDELGPSLQQPPPAPASSAPPSPGPSAKHKQPKSMSAVPTPSAEVLSHFLFWGKVFARLICAFFNTSWRVRR